MAFGGPKYCLGFKYLQMPFICSYKKNSVLMWICDPLSR